MAIGGLCSQEPHGFALTSPSRWGFLQISTSAETNLKFAASLERGSLDESGTFIPSAALGTQTNDAYAATPVTLSGTTAAGVHRLSVQAVGQVDSTDTLGASFSNYGSLVRTPAWSSS